MNVSEYLRDTLIFESYFFFPNVISSGTLKPWKHLNCPPKPSNHVISPFPNQPFKVSYLFFLPPKPSKHVISPFPSQTSKYLISSSPPPQTFKSLYLFIPPILQRILSLPPKCWVLPKHTAWNVTSKRKKSFSEWFKRCFIFFFHTLHITHFTFSNKELSRLRPQNVPKQSFSQGQVPQKTHFLNDPQPIFAIWLLHCWLMHHNLMSNCETLKSAKRPKASFLTSSVSTRNTAFRRSTANLGNLNVASLIDATHFILKLDLWSARKLQEPSFLQAQRAQKTQLLDGPVPILAIQMFHQ